MHTVSKSITFAFRVGATAAIVATAPFAPIVSTASAGTITSFTGSVVVGGVVQLVLPTRTLSENSAEGTYIYDGAAIDAFCIEVAQKVVLPSRYTPSILAQTTLAYGLLNSLYSQYYDINKFSSVGTAALQATIWEIYEDPSNLNFATGNFKLGVGTDIAVATLSAQMLQGIKTVTSPAAWEFTQYASATSQDLLTARRSGQVPLPTSAALLALGSVLLLGTKLGSKLTARIVT